MNSLYTLWKGWNDHAAMFLGIGLVAAVAWNWWQWRQDRALALRLHSSAPLPPCTPSPLPKVSVLVAAWNEADMIREHIQSFLELHYPDKELVLCAGGEDGTYQMAQEHGSGGVKVLEQQPGEGKQRALQRCLAHASGEVLFLTDADSLLDDHSFTRTLAPLLSEGEEVATGTSRPLQSQLHLPFVLYQWYIDLFVTARQPEFVSGVKGCNWAVKRTALEQIGGFPGAIQAGTDYYTAKLLLRAGKRIRYVPDSAVSTQYSVTFRSYWRRQSRWVRNLLLHGPKFGAYNEVWSALRTALA
ncbi:MAG: glycosyltransferase, partial [Chloroflexi bacterium]|nr:glycosyltransferase [Chloroflexota bacterium]